MAKTDQKRAQTPLTLTRCDTIRAQAIDWLWEDRIALGKLTLIAGEPGLGKSTITAEIAAIVSRGLEWPDGTVAPCGDVVMMSAEDNASDTILPRLLAARADLTRCHVLDELMVDDEDKPINFFTIKDGAERLDRTLSAYKGIKVVFIDPIASYLGKADDKNNSEMRAALTPIVRLAEKYNVAVIVVTHFNKGISPTPINKVIGSIGLPAAARVVFAVTADANDRSKRYFWPIKSNIGTDVTGFAFHIEQCNTDEGLKTTRVVWSKEPIATKDILAEPASEKTSATKEAEAFLKDLMSHGWMQADDVLSNAKGAGISASSLNTAKRNLTIISKKNGKDEWYWLYQNQLPNWLKTFKAFSDA